MNANFYVIHKTPKTHFATTVSILEQLLITFSTVQITQIKKKTFWKKLVTSQYIRESKWRKKSENNL